LLSQGSTDATPATRQEVVVLLHGIWCKALVMGLLAKRIRRAGYRTRCLSYASVGDTLDQNVAAVADKIAPLQGSTIHIVAHSYGGIIALRLLEQLLDSNTPWQVGRLVLLASPVRGSQLARVISSSRVKSLVLGNAASETLRTGLPDPMLQRVSAALPVGVISGSRNRSFLGSLLHRLDSGDGLVLERETTMPDAEQHSLPVSHAEILWSPSVAKAVCRFLTDAQFGAAGD